MKMKVPWGPYKVLWLETLALLGTLVSSSGLGKLQEVQV